MYQSEAMHRITALFSVSNNKVKTNDNITDNQDSNNNNKCVSVTLSQSVKTKKNWDKVLQFDLSVNTDWMPVMLKINI